MSSKSVSFFFVFFYKIYLVHHVVFFNNLLDSSCSCFFISYFLLCPFIFFIAPSESVLCVRIIGITGGLLGLGLYEASNLS